jgi:hypothetical protein
MPFIDVERHVENVRGLQESFESAQQDVNDLFERANELQEFIDNYKAGDREYTYEEIGGFMREKKDVMKEIRGLQGDARKSEREFRNAGKQFFRSFGQQVNLTFILDLHERDNNASINYYDENGGNIFEQGDAVGVRTLVITTHDRALPLARFRNNPRFEQKYSLDSYVVFGTLNHRNVIVVMFTSGRLFVIQSHIGVERLNFEDYIVSANAFFQE